MMTVTDLFAPYPDYDDKPAAVLVELAWNRRESLSKRAIAVASLGRRSASDGAVVEALEAIATDPAMRETRMFHLTSLAYLAIAGLIHGGTPGSVAAARRAAAGFTQTDREGLESFLHSGGLALS
jgi:hypothetical protein